LDPIGNLEIVGMIALNLIPISQNFSLKKFYLKYFDCLNKNKKFLLRINLVRSYDKNLKLMNRKTGYIGRNQTNNLHARIKTNCWSCNNRERIKSTYVDPNMIANVPQISSTLTSFSCNQCKSPMNTYCCICLSPIHLQLEHSNREFPYK
jgi:hypothetical protein